LLQACEEILVKIVDLRWGGIKPRGWRVGKFFQPPGFRTKRKI